jgi:hypothetical protein
MIAKFNDLLHLRFKQKAEQTSKMTALVEKSNNGDLSSFAGIFRVSALNAQETLTIEQLLKNYRSTDFYDVGDDLVSLSKISSEVKAISNQAIMLHGERIKRAQDILKRYKDGAFTAWLYAVYGNRQTPYNFLQYYEFYTQMPDTLHPLIDQMPRQIVYSLASRLGPLDKKEEVVKNYRGQSKKEFLDLIRIQFPLAEEDKRVPHFASQAIGFLKKAREALKQPLCSLQDEEQKQLYRLLMQLKALIER